MPTELRRRETFADRAWDRVQRIWFFGPYAPETRMSRDARLIEKEIRAEGFHPRTAPRDVIRRAYRKVRG